MEWRQFIDAAHLAKGPSVVYGPWLPEEAGNAQKTAALPRFGSSITKLRQRSVRKNTCRCLHLCIVDFTNETKYLVIKL
jgi:hypothetical protein